MRPLAVFFFAIVFLFSLDVFATHFNLRPCYNHRIGRPIINSSYLNCLNKNFLAIEKNFENIPFMEHCRNVRQDRVEWEFTNCVNENFKKIEDSFNNVNLRHCINPSLYRLFYSFEGCVNLNFKIIEYKHSENYRRVN